MPSPLGDFGHGSAGISAEGARPAGHARWQDAPRWQLTGERAGSRTHPRMILARSRVRRQLTRGAAAGGRGEWRRPRAEHDLRQQDGNGLALLQRLEVIIGPAQRADLDDQAHTGRNGTDGIGAVGGGGKEDRRAGGAGARHLLLYAADRIHRAVRRRFRPVPAMNLPPVRFIGVSLLMIPSANIIPALGPPMFLILIFTGNGKTKLSLNVHPDHGLALHNLASAAGSGAACPPDDGHLQRRPGGGP